MEKRKMTEEKVSVLYTVENKEFPSVDYIDAIKKLQELSAEYINMEEQRENNKYANRENGYVQPSKIYAKWHNLFVKKCLMPFPKKEEKKTVFIKWLDVSTLTDGGNTEDEIHLAVMTPEMLMTDYLFLARNTNWVERRSDIIEMWSSEIDRLYKPYYYAFDQYDRKNVDNSLLQMLKEKNNKGYKWFQATIRLADKEESEINISMNALRGNLCFSASQYETKDIFVEDIKNVKDAGLKKQIEAVDHFPQVANVIADVSKINVLNSINGLFDYKSYVRIYNVGQANCLYIHLKNWMGEQRIFFDVGRPFDKINDIENKDLSKSGVVNSFKYIASCSPDMIILSHWHKDHVQAAQTLGMDAYNKQRCEWLAPVPNKEAKETYKRLINYLMIRGIIKFIDRKNVLPSGEIANKGEITLYQGQGTADLNQSSLILKLKNTLLAGDCIYQYWPDSLKKDIDKIDNLIVPHHGGVIGFEDEKELNKRSKNKKGHAYICTGENEYGHPRAEHVKKLQETFIVETTSALPSNYYYRDVAIV